MGINNHLKLQIMEAVLGIIGIFILPVIVLGAGWITLIRTRHEERLKMIEKGIEKGIAEPKRNPNRYAALRTGLFMAGLAAGLLLGMFVKPYVPENDYDHMVIPVSGILFGGLGLMAYFMLSRKLQKKERMEDKNMDEFPESGTERQ